MKKQMKRHFENPVRTVDDVIRSLRKNFRPDDLVHVVLIYVSPIVSELSREGCASGGFLNCCTNTNETLIDYRNSLKEPKQA